MIWRPKRRTEEGAGGRVGGRTKRERGGGEWNGRSERERALKERDKDGKGRSSESVRREREKKAGGRRGRRRRRVIRKQIEVRKRI